MLALGICQAHNLDCWKSIKIIYQNCLQYSMISNPTYESSKFFRSFSHNLRRKTFYRVGPYLLWIHHSNLFDSFQVGTFECQCREGFKVDPGNPSLCTDIDECSNGSHTCQQVSIFSLPLKNHQYIIETISHKPLEAFRLAFATLSTKWFF